MEMLNNAEIISFANVRQWAAWLAKHYEVQAGVWIKIAKKSTGIPTVSHLEALDEALCYGWIDGQSKPYDETYYLQKFTPRRPASLWSKINIGKVETLLAAGRMQPAGQAAIDAAKADGRWDRAYQPQSDATVPDDFATALERSPKAKAFFETLNKANRYSFIWRVVTAKKAETRQARIAKLITMLEEEKQFH
ncbi:MAG TPA: YdeI/OmpD-associated family protein [Candidatus Saccharimonadales bacterium]|jgi:uncharacterized protein YdeI (YjbR/CyaY-like superfamily)|nr:YdeI/OmpD-associated family protein [Candidatus Saccharimonadales bacterium]